MSSDDRASRLGEALQLLDAEAFDAAATELRSLVVELDGRALIEALIALSHAGLWTEQTEEAIACAERALALADEAGDDELRAPALAALSQVYGQRGLEGDLGRALELGDRALATWVPETRDADLAAHRGLHALTKYWAGRYVEAVDLGRAGADGATEALALAALGRSEEAIATSDGAIASAREAGSALLTAYALCCSTAALRDVLDLDEARRRDEEAIDLYRSIPFESGVMQGEMDLLYADLAADQPERAAAAWPALWARLDEATGWERWLAPGRLSVANAEIAVRQGRWEVAADAAIEAIDIARRIARTKYDVSARIALGMAWVGSGRITDGIEQLRTAAAGADALVHPPTRWRAHTAVGRALEAMGDERGASAATDAAIDIATSYAATLAPDHSAAVLGSPEVQALTRV